ncbi:MAG: CvpA family protein [Kiritimatiellales bacterium]|nr:CvpA family protein [Kiritimatiellales bacterium]MCF7864553.1 CvpA family protein [Kiritimatiellales bacterium]
MHIAIDILAAIVLLFFFLSGWTKGFLLSLLGVARVVLSYTVAYFSGRYLGYWLGEAIHRPRLVTIPVCAFMAFVLVGFGFHIIMVEIRAHRKGKEHVPHSFFSALGGGGINLVAGTFSLVLLFWLADLFLAGAAGSSIPGANKSYFARFARRAVYETAYCLIPKKDNEQQIAAMAGMISQPANGIHRLETVISAPAVQQMISDKQLAADLFSGEAARIEQNPSIQQLFNDRATLDELRELGVLSGYETKSGICEKLARVGDNKKIQASVANLKEKQLLSTDKITQLVRDPDFDTILAELVK